jgi:protein gp37
MEPLLAPVPDLHKHLDGIHWVIVGAESGPKARPMSDDWVREIRDQCIEAKVAFFYKQRIEDGRKVEMPELDGQVWAQIPESTR